MSTIENKLTNKMFYDTQHFNTYFVGFTLIGRHLTLQKLRPVFLDVLPRACFVQHSSKETNDLGKIKDVERMKESSENQVETF